MRLLGLALLLAGCATVQDPFGGPAHPALASYGARIEHGLVDDLYSPTTMAERNATLDGYLFGVDLQFDAFVNGLYGTQATSDTVTDLFILALSSSSALVSGEVVKTVLAAGAAALAGAKAVVKADLWGGQERVPLIATMRELRAAKRAEIERGKRKRVREYSLSTGMLDVLDYATIGVVRAIEKLTERSTKALVVEQENLERVRALPVEED